MTDNGYKDRPTASLSAFQVAQEVACLPNKIRRISDDLRPQGLLRQMHGEEWDIVSAIAFLEGLEREAKYLRGILNDELDSRSVAGVR